MRVGANCWVVWGETSVDTWGCRLKRWLEVGLDGEVGDLGDVEGELG